MPQTPVLPDPSTFLPVLKLARDEDLGGGGIDGDVTGRLLVPKNAVGVGTIVQKSPGVCCGLPLVQHVCGVFDERLRVEMIPGFHFEILEGRHNDSPAMPLVRVRGPMRSLLAVERTLLNLLGRLGGVATLTRKFVRRVEGTAVTIYDTRKTLPGLRTLDKYAVRVGGGQNHRVGLFDMVLVKDNHLAGVPPRRLAEHLSGLLAGVPSGLPVEVEVDTLEQLAEVLNVDRVRLILLDNMDCPTMTHAVAMRDAASSRGHRAQLEASGGVTLETVRMIADTGVDRIAVGSITHSAAALDVSLEIEPA